MAQWCGVQDENEWYDWPGEKTKRANRKATMRWIDIEDWTPAGLRGCWLTDGKVVYRSHPVDFVYYAGYPDRPKYLYGELITHWMPISESPQRPAAPDLSDSEKPKRKLGHIIRDGKPRKRDEITLGLFLCDGILCIAFGDCSYNVVTGERFSPNKVEWNSNMGWHKYIVQPVKFEAK